jgi:tyrosine-protein kinase Etk/Wzc
MIEEEACNSHSAIAAAHPRSTESLPRVPDDSMLDFLTHLIQRKWLIARFTGASLTLGLILFFVLPVHYTAVTRIMPPKQTQSTTSFLNSEIIMGSLAEAAGNGLLTDPNAIYMGLLKSRPVADAIISRFQLTSVYRVRDMTGARRTLENRTKILSEPSTLISITVSDSNRARAAAIANAYTEQLRELTKSISVSEASRRRLFFGEQLNTQKEALIAAELAFQRVQLSKGLIHLDSQANVLRAQVAARQVELQALQSYSTERNPDVQLAERELSAMQAELAQMEQHSGPPGSSAIALTDVPKAGLDYIRAQRELQYQQAFFDMLLRQYEAARLDEAKEAAVIQVVEPAIEPDRRTSPRLLIILPLAAFIGLFLGCLAALLLHRLDLERADPEGAEAIRRLQSAFRK